MLTSIIRPRPASILAAPLMLAALARLSKTAAPPDPRPIDRQPRQPVRVAEEMAMVDVLSHAAWRQLRGVAVLIEILPANAIPGADERASVGGARSHRQNAGPTTTVLSVRGALFFFYIARSYLGRVRFRQRIADLDQPHEQRRRRASGRARLRVQRPFLTGFEPQSVFLKAIVAVGARARPRSGVCRSTGLGLCGADLCRAKRGAGRGAGAEKLLWYITANKVPPHFSKSTRLCSGGVERANCARGGALFGQRYVHQAKARSTARLKRHDVPPNAPIRFLRQINKTCGTTSAAIGHLSSWTGRLLSSTTDTVHGIRMFAREVYQGSRDLSRTMVSGASKN